MLKAELLERTIVFVQRILPDQNIKLFSEFATPEFIGRKQIYKGLSLDDLEYGNDMFPNKSISLPTKNVKIVGYPDRITIFMIDPKENDKDFYDGAKKFSEKLSEENISGVGVNANFFIPTKIARQLIKNKILNTGPSIYRDSITAGFKMVFEGNSSNCSLNIHIDEGTSDLIELNQKEGIIIVTNYHRDIDKGCVKKQLQEFRDELNTIHEIALDRMKKIEEFFNE